MNNADDIYLDDIIISAHDILTCTTGTETSTPPSTNLCFSSTASTVTTTTSQYTWTCTGTDGSVSCSVPRIVVGDMCIE